MTVDQILRDIDEHGLSFGCNRLNENGREQVWYARVGDYKNARRGATFEAAVLAAWAAYTNAETRA